MKIKISVKACLFMFFGLFMMPTLHALKVDKNYKSLEELNATIYVKRLQKANVIKKQAQQEQRKKFAERREAGKKILKLHTEKVKLKLEKEAAKPPLPLRKIK